MKRTNRTVNVKSPKRNVAGIYFVETLVALILGALFCFLMLQLLAQTMRVTSNNQNNTAALLLAQTILDSVKSTSPSNWTVGTYPLLVNSSTSGQTGGIHPLPIGLNVGYLNWTNKSVNNEFTGTATLTIENAANATDLNAVATVVYADSQAAQSKKISIMTTLHPQGVNFW